MARHSVSCKIGSTTAGLERFDNLGRTTDVVNTVATTTVAANVATLVADGATPTQAHVTTLNTNWTALLAGTGAVPANADVVLSFDTTAVGTRTVLRKAVDAMLRIIEGGNELTP